MQLFLAIILGILFGFALNRVGATNPENIINMLRLKDLRLMKTILFAIGLSSILLFAGIETGIVDMAHISIKSAYTGVIIGGALLGIGFAISGYCPGTGLTALASGRKDALFFLIGGLTGAFAYTLCYEHLTTYKSLFKKIAGGSVSLANTGNTQYMHLIDGFSGTLLGIFLGIMLVIIAFLLPEKTASSS